jgi:heavy metal sensor kinase
VTLTTRLSLFFLGMLALVLVGFSGALYVVAHHHLHRQTEERLDAALGTLLVAAEVGPDGVEWEPQGRQLAVGPRGLEDSLIWLVHDDRGRIVDRSAPSAAAEGLGEDVASGTVPSAGAEWEDRQGGHWLIAQRWVRPAATQPGASLPVPEGDAPKYSALSITVGVPLDPVRDTLRQLAGVLVGLSAGVWMAAFFAGRGMCRRALLPVRRMAASARDMNAADLGQRLPVSASRDELEDLGRSFNGLLDRLQESFRRQQRFTGDASHQLRTPLTALLGEVEVALRRERPADEYRAALTSVKKQALHLRRIVEALLFLARADAEARVPDVESIELGSWLEQHLRTWSSHPRAGDLRLEREPEQPLRVRAQPALLGELVNILVENACKYSPLGTPITLCLGRDGEQVTLAVEDEGEGIAAEELPHLCEPFFRSAEARRRGIAGLGLGLAIARRVAEAFGGRLLVQSWLGKGSRFTVSLDLAPPDHGPA